MKLIGLDPGGKKSFGWAVLSVGPAGTVDGLTTGVCSDAISALREASEVADDPPTAVGIDAPLFWSVNGDRLADALIRKLVCAAGGHSGTVGHVNSLRGACLVQGVLAACRAAELWPSVLVTEAHPKALLRISSEARKFIAKALLRISSEARKFIAVKAPATLCNHERDAALAAYAAWALAASFKGWRDLVRREQGPFFPGGREVFYWFPAADSPSSGYRPPQEALAGLDAL